MMSHWIYDRSPLEGVQFEGPLRELKDDIAVRLLCVVCRQSRVLNVNIIITKFHHRAVSQCSRTCSATTL